MDMFGLLIAVVIAIPVLAIVSIALTIGTRERLKRLEFAASLGLEWLAPRTRLAGTTGEAPRPSPPRSRPRGAALSTEPPGRG